MTSRKSWPHSYPPNCGVFFFLLLTLAYLCPFFILSAIFELGIFHFTEAEIAELLIPFPLAIMTLSYQRSFRHNLDPHAQNHWQRRQSQRLAKQIAVLFITLLCLSVTTTRAVYSSPLHGPETERLLIRKTLRYFIIDQVE